MAYLLMNPSKAPAGQQVRSCRHSLTRLRTHWAIGVTTAAVVLGAAASYLVGWVSGLAQHAIFDFIERWYTNERLRSTLGYLSPAECEQQLLTAA